MGVFPDGQDFDLERVAVSQSIDGVTLEVHVDDELAYELTRGPYEPY
jgi:hypothetical protein